MPNTDPYGLTAVVPFEFSTLTRMRQFIPWAGEWVSQTFDYEKDRFIGHETGTATQKIEPEQEVWEPADLFMQVPDFYFPLLLDYLNDAEDVILRELRERGEFLSSVEVSTQIEPVGLAQKVTNLAGQLAAVREVKGLIGVLPHVEDLRAGKFADGPRHRRLIFQALAQGDALEVYAVRPGDMSEDLAVFVNEEDAKAFRSTFDHVGEVEDVILADHETAKAMVSERLTYQVEGDDAHGYTVMEDGEYMNPATQFNTREAAQKRADALNHEQHDDEEDDEAAKERATCSTCLARTYHDEECVCGDDSEDGAPLGDAEDYDEVRQELAGEEG